MTSDAARQAALDAKVAEARRDLEHLPPADRYNPDRMTPGMVILDGLYEKAGLLRRRDPVIRRLRKAETRSATNLDVEAS